MTFIDLFAGMGGFHRALTELGHECVFASELDKELRDLYEWNFPEMKGRVAGDIRKAKESVPKHEILCAGFPCQPFSKSGGQLGTRDETRGTLFHEILEILETHRPKYVILENVGNFGRHDSGRTWAIVKDRLEKLKYFVEGTEHVTPPSSRDWRDAGAARGEARTGAKPGSRSGGPGLLSPHHFGYPQHRERFFVVASLERLPVPAFPVREANAVRTLADLIGDRKLTKQERDESQLSESQKECILHWNRFIRNLPERVELPSFPLWGDEIWSTYPYKGASPWNMQAGRLRKKVANHLPSGTSKSVLLEMLPTYARERCHEFRQWKKNFIESNRAWWSQPGMQYPDASWVDILKAMPPSFRKLEWNVKGGERDLWRHVLQFRPSGLRVKRYTSIPALVAMTETQIPVLGPERRFLTRVEGLLLQGFPEHHRLPDSRAAAFRALGNAVHVGVVRRVAKQLLEGGQSKVEAPAQLRLHLG